MDRAKIGVALGAFALAAAAATLAGAGAQDASATRTVPATDRCYAVVRAGAVENVVCWDGAEPWSPPTGTMLIEVTPTTGAAEPGGTWDGAAFVRRDASADVAAAKATARAEAVRLTAEADAAAALAAVEADATTRDALLADEAALRTAAAAALAAAR